MARVALHLPAAGSGVIHVDEDVVDISRFTDNGWERVDAARTQGRRRSDTGQIPTQSTTRAER